MVSGNAALENISNEALRKKFLCQEHFQPSDFIQPLCKYLKSSAVPIHYKLPKVHLPSTISASPPLKVLTPKKAYARTDISSFSPSYTAPIQSTPTKQKLTPRTRRFLEEVCEMSSPDLTERASKRKLHFSDSDVITPKRKKIQKLQHTLAQQSKLLRSKRTQISRLKTTAKVGQSYSDIAQIIATYPYPSPEARAIVTMQTLHRKRSTWNRDEKKLALALFYSSPSAYRMLRRRKVVLPGIATVRKWIGSSAFPTGFNKFLFSKIRIKSSTMLPMEQACVICFDEMAIKENFVYSPVLDLIEGYEDLGSAGRTKLSAKKALVFMARGLYAKWKMPIGYFLSNKGVDAKNLVVFINDCLDKVTEAGFNPLAIVCDQGTSNVSAVKALGCSADAPYFIHKERKVYLTFHICSKASEIIC